MTSDPRRPLDRSSRSRWLALALVVAATASLGGCGTGTSTLTAPPEAPGSAAQQDIASLPPTPSASPAMPSATGSVSPSADRSDAPSSSPAVSPSPATSPSAASVPASAPATSGPFRMDVYRSDAFVTQPNLLYCVPGAASIMVNLVRGARVVGPEEMAAMYAYGQSLAAYPDEGAGVDPVGWVGILTRWGAPGYAWRSYASLADAIHQAAGRLRATGRPVGIPVGIHRGHAWVISGFAATADPASGVPYTVTAVAVTGALWPTQRYYLGYFDMPPDTWLTVAKLAGAAKTFRADVVTRWDGRFVTIEP